METTPEAHAGFLILSQIAALLRRLTSDLYDRLQSPMPNVS